MKRKKIMEKYTKYCTEEQTKRAFKLGAPIINIAKCGVPSTYPFMEIDGVDFYIPTTQQMIGWLGEKYHIKLRFVIVDGGTIRFTICQKNKFISYIGKNPQKVELSAIDAALDYLEKGE